MGQKLPYFKWSYSYKKNLLELFLKKADQTGIKEPFTEYHILQIHTSLTGQKGKTVSFRSLIMLLEKEKIKLNREAVHKDEV